MKLGLFSTKGTLLEKWEIPTRTANDGVHVLPDVAQSIVEAMDRNKISAAQVAGIGIGVPGPVDENFTVNKCVNLGWGVFNLKERMNALLPDIPNVAAGNDANVAALGELWQGGGQGNQSAVMLTLGTGVGGGVVLDGKIIAGKNGGAGEIGHMTVDINGEKCPCGNIGCLECYIPQKAILKRFNFSDYKQLVDAAYNGTPEALKAIDQTASYFAAGLIGTINLLDLESVILYGELNYRCELLISKIQKLINERCIITESHPVQVMPSLLSNEDNISFTASTVIEQYYQA